MPSAAAPHYLRLLKRMVADAATRKGIKWERIRGKVATGKYGTDAVWAVYASRELRLLATWEGNMVIVLGFRRRNDREVYGHRREHFKA